MLGICGTGMGSLAILLKELGYSVTGSDENIYPPMSDELKENEIAIFKGYSPDNLSQKPDIAIIGNVITKTNPEAKAVLSLNIPYLSMPQAVSKFLLKDKHSIVVTGTHGKTTTATLAAWLLQSASFDPGFLIGGIGKNLNTSAKISSLKYFVIEGDEYDTAFFDKGPKFLHYSPQSAILGPVEFDHADIYKDLDAIMASFEKLVKIIPANGLIAACADSSNVLKLIRHAKCRVITYGLSEKASYRAEFTKATEKGTDFVLASGSSRTPFCIPMWGDHNLQNAAGVLALLIELGVPPQKLATGLLKFEGVKRRQEIRGVTNGITIIDDFAHHPTAIKETVRAMRLKYPKSKIWAIFEPRSNTTKRNIFQNELAEALAASDSAIIAGVFHPEKIPEDLRLNPSLLAKTIVQAGKSAEYIADTGEIVEFLAKNAKNGDILLIMSNGGFDNIHEKLLRRLA
ncbi:MAG: UDP-N-acetylmuramate:L-alanyl-gamma-D-glutamyl-meso-diaminopimelate ligase [Deltaproteobacteria bacterium]|nr:UDP-N-acetylmuramate:L-alanyl-gamma-D-glutamyl-meso-diaminopimelate ligase [Deltaproteobacteria bacterium]